MNDIEMLRRIKTQRGYSLKIMSAKIGVTLRTLFRWLHKESKPSPMAQEKITAFIHAELVDSRSFGHRPDSPASEI